MGTDKRERQKAGRAARVEAAVAAQKRAQTRRRIWWVIGLAVFVLAAVGVLALVAGDDDDGEVASSTSSSSTTTSPAAVESAAGKPCVAVSEPLPAGAPEVPIQEGPPPTSLVVEDLEEGDGPEIPAGATVTVDYIGVSCSTGAIFDSSYSRGEPATFPLDGVIQGWTEGIPGMKVGGTRLLGIPSEQAYGPSGRPPTIAPDEALWFVVQAKDVQPAGAAPSVP